MPKVIVTDSIDPAGIEILSQVAEVDVKLKLPPEELVAAISEYDAIMIRSGTQVTKEVVEAGTKLKIVGRAGVGVDNVDIPAATRAGIVVVNSPEGNTIAAAEQAVTLMLSLSRHTAQANASLKSGKWERKKFIGVEVYKKSLGIVGLGKIGSHVAQAAKAMGMKILAFDPYLSNERAQKLGVSLVDFDALIEQADYISLHIPRTPETANMFNAEVFKKMKPTARIINCARGGLINEEDLYEALKSGEIAGAALDVYEQEPPPESPLWELDKEIVLTPHLGASTEEAQANVAIDVAEQIRDVLLGLPARSAVNIPGLMPEALQELQPYLAMAERLGRMVGQLAGDRITQLDIRLQGDLAQKDSQPIIIAALKGLLSLALRERVNYVNASIEAQERGIRVVETRDAATRDYAGSLQLKAYGSNGERSITGALLSDNELRITSIDSYPINVPPSDNMLMTLHRDMPGMIGRIGSLLGSYNVNIASMHLGRQIVRGDAVMILSLDDPLPEGLIAEIRKDAGIRDAYMISL